MTLYSYQTGKNECHKLLLYNRPQRSVTVPQQLSDRPAGSRFGWQGGGERIWLVSQSMAERVRTWSVEPS